jgi:lysyl-tRNA synthetase, class II
MGSSSNILTGMPDLNGVIVRVLRKRKSSHVVFLTIRAHESTYQAALRRDTTELFSEVKSVPTGSLLRLYGHWGTTESGATTFIIHRAMIEHRFEGVLPDKHHGLANEQRHLNRSMDLVTNAAYFRYSLLGADITAVLREVLRGWKFREFNTGILQRRFEGGLANPFTTLCNANGQEYYLSLTSELKLKRLVAAGAERVCEITQSFRNEGLSKVHSPEFTLLEAYGADMTYLDIIEMVEEMLRKSYEVAYPADKKPKVSFVQKTYREVCATYVESAEPDLEYLIKKFPNQFTEGMHQFTWVMKLLETIIGPNLVEPTFVTRLPSGLSPLVRCSDDDPSVTDRAFLFAKGYFICDIYTDENSVEVLEAELRKQATLTGRAMDSEYLQCIRLGIPPTAGVGLGINRLHMLFLPDELSQHIRETILYPLG